MEYQTNYDPQEIPLSIKIKSTLRHPLLKDFKFNVVYVSLEEDVTDGDVIYGVKVIKTSSQPKWFYSYGEDDEV